MVFNILFIKLGFLKINSHGFKFKIMFLTYLYIKKTMFFYEYKNIQSISVSYLRNYARKISNVLGKVLRHHLFMDTVLYSKAIPSNNMVIVSSWFLVGVL